MRAANSIRAIPVSILTFPEFGMDLQPCTEALRAKVDDSSGLNATLEFDCGVDGVAALLTSEFEPSTGFMMGKVRVSGDMSVVMKLQRVV